MSPLFFPQPQESEAAEALRAEVRTFLASTLAGLDAPRRAQSWTGYDADFSRRLGERGWLGMTWPKRYGGHERSAFERYVVIEEILAAGAPVAAHWFAERQTGPLLLRFGTEAQKQGILPRIAAGTCFVSIGMSEPDVGSDLAAIRTRAVPVPGGWTVNGTKLWTTNAHRSDYLVLFCRTSGTPADRHKGTSQLLVDLRATQGVSIRPVIDMAGQHHFNEVSFQDAFVPSDALIGTEGEGWAQVMSELAYERSGPERFLSSMALIVELVRILEGNSSDHARLAIGRLVAHLAILRRLSRGVAALLDRGENPSLQAAVVKDLGAVFEQEVPEIARTLVDAEADRFSPNAFPAVLAHILLTAPSFSLRGGTREILRGIIARGLGLR
jgi:alkylation response protein AidB-like acyl-CoA dehydrogenase